MATTDYANTPNGLLNQAHYYHRLVEENLRKGIEYAKLAGDFLRKAKSKVGHGKWLSWLRENWESSIETAQIYMRMSKNWKHPRIQHARRLGFPIDSIQTFLHVLTGEMFPEDRLAEMLRSAFIGHFARKMHKLDLGELEALEERIESLLGGDWDRQLKREVCGHYEFDYYEARFDESQDEDDLELARERAVRRQRIQQTAIDYNRQLRRIPADYKSTKQPDPMLAVLDLDGFE